MNREMRRLMEREERRQKKQKKESGSTPARRPAPAGMPVRSQPAIERKPLVRRLSNFLREVRQELKKVSWPSREQMVIFTTITLITTVALTLVIFGLDVAMKEIVLQLLGRSG